MTSIARKLIAGAILAGGAMAAGCHHADKSHEWHGDPCWPERYSNDARRLTVAAFEPQVQNGHVLDQTVWNSHFEYNSDRLTGAGLDKLDQLSRRRPAPDTRLYLQTARDVPYDPEKPAEYGTRRTELDAKRVAAIKKYLGASLTGRQVNFEIDVHDPAPPGIEGAAPRVIIPPPATRVGGTGGSGGAGAAPGGTAAPGGGSAPAPAQQNQGGYSSGPRM